MLHLTPQEKTVLKGLLIIVLLGTLINLALKHEVSFLQWAKTVERHRAVAQTNINRVSVQDLMNVPGIGKRTAERILEYRQAHGPFTSLDQIKNIKGIPAKRYERIIQHFKI